MSSSGSRASTAASPGVVRRGRRRGRSTSTVGTSLTDAKPAAQRSSPWHDRGDAAHGVVALPPRDLDERRPAARRGRAGKNAETASSSGRSADSIGPTKNSSAATSRVPAVDAGLDRAVEQAQHRRHLGGRVGVHQAADGGAAVADRRVGDVRAAPGAAAAAPRRTSGVGQQVGVPHQRPDADPGLGHLDGVEAGDVVDVDEVRAAPRAASTSAAPGSGRPRAPCASLAGEGVERLVEGARSVVGEAERLHVLTFDLGSVLVVRRWCGAAWSATLAAGATDGRAPRRRPCPRARPPGRGGSRPRPRWCRGRSR